MKTYFNYPTRIIFGQGVIDDLVNELNNIKSKRPLIITDRGLIKTDIPERILGIIKKGGLEGEIFSDIEPNPTDSQIDESLKVFLNHNADSIVAVGGGSPIDAGKGLQIRINHHEPLEVYDDLLGGDTLITKEIPPLIAIPTTAGTGSEVSRSAVITIAAVDRKVVLFSPRLMPTVAICDPELTYGLPPRITAETGMDALSHNLEAFFSKGYHPMADGIALKGMELIASSLIKAVENGKDVQARQDMMMASTMGAVAFQKGLGVIHSLAHPLSSVTKVSHGLANAIMMPHAIRFNGEVIGDRIKEVARVLKVKESSVEGVAKTIEEMCQKMGLPLRLSEVGVTQEHIPKLVEKAMIDGCHRTNPRSCTEEDMKKLFQMAM